MKDKALLVVSKTNINLKLFENTHLMVGIERGCLDLIEKDVTLDLAISDFDQVTDEEIKLIDSKAIDFLHLNKEKDYLDGIAAINYLNDKGFKDITMVVNPSIRYDMNLTIIDYLLNHNLKILNDNSLIFKIEKGLTTLEFEKFQDFTYISFFSTVDNTFSIKGLKYETENSKLRAFDSFAYSNEFIPYVDADIKSEQNMIVIMTK